MEKTQGRTLDASLLILTILPQLFLSSEGNVSSRHQYVIYFYVKAGGTPPPAEIAALHRRQ